MKKIKNFISNTYIKVKDLVDNKLLKTRKSSVLFLTSLVLSVLFIIQLVIILFNNSIYNNGSDDILQYYVMMEGFIRSVKEGSLSFFDMNNYFGASFFSSLYYVPLDIFTLLTLILSFVMPMVVAVSSTELIKITVGVMLVGIYLALKNYKPKTIFWVGLIYFISGGSVSFMNFPAFLSMTVYLPLSLIVIHYFFKKKYWVVPLFVFAIVLYNFYLAYMILAFISFAYILEYFKYNDFKFKAFILNGLGFLSLLLLGVMMSSTILLPAITFISEETIRSPVEFEPWIVNLKFFKLKLFQPEVYIRYFAKLYAPQRPVNFSGFLRDYKLEHVSNYVSIIGFMLMLFVFFIKGRMARIYKIMFGVLLVFTLLPIFSSLLSGTLVMEMFSNGSEEAFPYNRWLNMVPLLQVLVIAFVIETYDFKKSKVLPIIIVGLPLLTLGVILVVYYTKQLKLDIVDGFFFEALTVDKIFMIVSLAILFLALMAILIKKIPFLKGLLFLEVVIAVGYMFISGFASQGKLATFNEMNQINDYINENVEQDVFSRVYVDLGKFDVQDRNFNQMTTLPTNTRVFHSWSDSETDDLAFLMFPNTSVNDERQSKIKMNYYSYYLSTFLGYKYILTDSKDSSLESNSDFELVNKNDQFAMYKILPVDGFYVYDKYMTYKDFKTFSRKNPQVASERVFLQGVIIDQSRYNLADYNLTELLNSEIQYSPIDGNVRPYEALKYSYSIERKALSNPSKTGDYYVYDDFVIDYQSGEITLRDNSNHFDQYGEVFYQNDLGEEKLCKISKYKNDSSNTIIQCGQFFSPIKKIFVEKTSSLSQPPQYIKRLERAIEGKSYLVYDLSIITEDFTDTLLNFSFSNYEIKNSIIIDELGLSLSSVNGLYSPTDKMKAMYIEKTAELYDHSDLFALYLDYSAIGAIGENLIADSDKVTDKQISIQKGKIDLSYSYLAQTSQNNIIVIPVTYSDDWQFTSREKYDKISVSGGFLGIVIPEGTNEVNISLKFVPKSLNSGLKISIVGGLIYLGVISLPLLMKRYKWRLKK